MFASGRSCFVIPAKQAVADQPILGLKPI